jgi:hypothetical protein
MKALEDAQQQSLADWEREKRALREKMDVATSAPASQPDADSSSVILLMREAEQQQQKEWAELTAKAASATEKLDEARRNKDERTADEMRRIMADVESEQQSRYHEWDEQNTELRRRLEDSTNKEEQVNREVEKLKEQHEKEMAALRKQVSCEAPESAHI